VEFRRVTGAAAAAIAVLAMAACNNPKVTPPQVEACTLQEGALLPGNSNLIPKEKLTCSTGKAHEYYSKMYDALHSDDRTELADAVTVILYPYGADAFSDESLALQAGFAVFEGASCAEEIVAHLRDDLQIQYVRHSDSERFFTYLGKVASFAAGAKFFPKGSPQAPGKQPTKDLVEGAITGFGKEIGKAGQGIYIRGSDTRYIVSESLQRCGTGGPVSSRADANPELEPYVVNSVAGMPAGPVMWMGDTVPVSNFIEDPSGYSWTVYDKDLHPVDLRSVREPAVSYAIPGGALTQAGDANNVMAWQGVQHGRHAFTVPFSLYSQPVVGYRYLVQPREGNQCGGTVWDLRAGTPTAIVLPADQCLMAISDHYGMIQGDSDVPQVAVDLLTGEVMSTPEIYATDGQLSYSYDGVSWTVPVVPDDVSVSYDRVVYTSGDEVVVLDSADGSELRRWSKSDVLQRPNCLLQGPMAEERVLFICSDNPRSNVAAETVVVGHRPMQRSGRAEGGNA
jgi:hypothetical protein